MGSEKFSGCFCDAIHFLFDKLLLLFSFQADFALMTVIEIISSYRFFKQLHGRIELASFGDYDFVFAIYFPQFQSNFALPG
jgi:hypothetical protein